MEPYLYVEDERVVEAPTETNDLYLDRPEIVARLTAEFDAIRRGDATPLPPP